VEGSKRFAGFHGLRPQASEREAAEKIGALKGVLIDSDILIEVSRARDHAILARWDELSRSDAALLCSPVTVAELWHGVRPHEHAVLEALFLAIECVPIDLVIGTLARNYLRQYAKSHHVELGDALIAATASAHELNLWTRNRRHYPMKGINFV
jgi:predicted nucleic acid-binding protein